MRFTTFALFVAATLAGFGVAQEAYHLPRRAVPDWYPPSPGPPPDRPLPPLPPSSGRRHRREAEAELNGFQFPKRSTPDWYPPSPGPPPDRPLPPLPSSGRRHRREAEAEAEFAELSAREIDEMTHFAREAEPEEFDFYERDFNEEYY